MSDTAAADMAAPQTEAPETAAIVMSRIDAGRVADDGSVLLIKGAQPGGQEIILAVPADQLVSLVDLAALGQSQCRILAGISADHREAFSTSWWELARDQASKSVILSLTFGSGGRLDFLLSDRMPEQMLETLEVLTGRSIPRSPGIRPS